MHTLAFAIPCLCFGVLVGVRGQVVTWTIASATIAAVVFVLLLSGAFSEAGFVMGSYVLGLSGGLFFRR